MTREAAISIALDLIGRCHLAVVGSLQSDGSPLPSRVEEGERLHVFNVADRTVEIGDTSR